MTELIWLLIGLALGLWFNSGDVNHYKNIVKFQDRYIDHLHKKIDGEQDD